MYEVWYLITSACLPMFSLVQCAACVVYSTWWCTATLCLVLCCLCSVWYLVIHGYPMFSAVRCLVPWWYTLHSYSMFSAVLPVRCLVPGGAWLPPPVLPPRLALPCIQITQRHLCTGGRRRHSKRLSQVGTFKIPFNYGVCPFVTVSQFVATVCCQKQWTIFCSHTPSKWPFFV